MRVDILVHEDITSKKRGAASTGVYLAAHADMLMPPSTLLDFSCLVSDAGEE